jgi:hypothetical protein
VTTLWSLWESRNGKFDFVLVIALEIMSSKATQSLLNDECTVTYYKHLLVLFLLLVVLLCDL